MTRIKNGVILLLCCFQLLACAASASSLEKAELLMAEEKWPRARDQFRAAIRKSGGAERDRAYLGLARTYFMEKDFRGLDRSLQTIAGRIPETQTGAWIHVMLYRSARMLGDAETATKSVQALSRLRRHLSVLAMVEHIRLLRELDLIAKAPAVPLDSGAEGFRQSYTSQAEALMAADILGGAIRMWTALTIGRPDRYGQNALFRLAQALDAEGDVEEAAGYLKLYVVLFPEDPKSADALYRLAKWSQLLGTGESRTILSSVAELYPGTLYGVKALIETARAWPEKNHVVAVVRALKSSPGLPDAYLEPALALALRHSDWIASDPDRTWIAHRYLSSFPLGSSAVAARELVHPAK